MNEESKDLIQEVKHQLWHLVENTRKQDTFDMLTWAFNLGQHSNELRKHDHMLAKYIDAGTTKLADGRDVYEIDKEDLEGLYHRLQFIAVNMVP